MISNTTGSIDREVAACQQRLAAGAHSWLSLAAAPIFAIMAVLTGVLGGGPPDILCSAAEQASPLGGMMPMYLLMAALHSQPWLKLIASRRQRRLSGHHASDRALAGGGCRRTLRPRAALQVPR
jgi:hypothetical protein